MRRLSLLTAAGLLLLALVAAALPRRVVHGDGPAAMRRASGYVDSIAAVTQRMRDPGRIPVPIAVAVGYAERLRLGLGSPYRLIDFALHDPRMDDSLRARVAWALLDGTSRGVAYMVDPAVLDGATPTGDSSGRGAAHLSLITNAVAHAATPDVGERAVRLAYVLAAAERTVRDEAVPVVAAVAALTRDRLLAQADVPRLFAAARTDGVPVFTELEQMRAARQLMVEQPARASSDDDDAHVVALARTLLDSVRAISRPAVVAVRDSVAPSLLGGASAARLAQIGAALPPESPVVVSMRSYRSALQADDSAVPVRRSRAHFASTAVNDETLAGAYGVLRARGDSAATPALAVAAAATALRAYAQETPWFPGDAGPSDDDLRREQGIASVTFDRAVPLIWRPYYRRMLATSIRDLQQVLPAFSAEGVHVHFGVDGLPDSALAMHDPSTRTIRLSINSSAGTLAHELSHDLDWQAARVLYASGGGYSTDRASSGEGHGPLASSVRGLTAARLVSPWEAATGRPAPGKAPVAPNESQRPAELFARDMDWFIGTTLAARGERDGYLTSVQDAALSGYAGASPVEIGPGAARALMDAAREMTDIPEAASTAFVDRTADPATADLYLVAVRALGTGVRSMRGRGAARVYQSRLEGLSVVPAVCLSVPSGASDGLRARAELMEMALDARARGLVRTRAAWIPESRRPAWARSILGEAPWAPGMGAQVVQRVRGALAAELAGASVLPVFPRVTADTAGCAR